MKIAAQIKRCVIGCMIGSALVLPQVGITETFSFETASLSSRHQSDTHGSDTVQDYSHSLQLDTHGRQGVLAFRLPQSVYLHARSASLNDLRLFDATGQAIPFALHNPVRQQYDQQSLATAIFPLKSNRHPSSGEAIALDVRTAADGTLLSVTTSTGKKDSGQASTLESLTGLVLDVRLPMATDRIAERPLINALRFTLPASLKPYSAEVRLEVSNDLKQWETIREAELSWLVNEAAQTLANDRLEFPPHRFRYARLTWRSGTPVQFESITAESLTTSENAALESLLLQPQAGKQAEDLVYHAGIAIPVEKIGLEFDEQNVVFPAAIGRYQEIPRQRAGKEKIWEFAPIIRANFYRITQTGQQRSSSDISVPVTHLADWVLRPQIPTTSKPALKLSWQPSTLIFLASGSEPYTLAFGRDQVKAARLDLSQVAPGFTETELKKLELAEAGPLRIHSQLASEESGIETEHLRKWILWGVLLLGVAVLGVLAHKLIRQMK